jgi:hypothetical protein
MPVPAIRIAFVVHEAAKGMCAPRRILFMDCARLAVVARPGAAP